MAKEIKKPVTAPVVLPKEEKDKKPADAPALESEGDELEEEEGEESDEDDTDYDAELAKEEKLGKPDPKKAATAFADRKKKRTVPEEVDEPESDEPEGDEEEDDEDRPLTRREMNAVLAANRKEQQETDALAMAKTMAGSDKEAALIVAKWKNRTFPTGLSLVDQIQEAYAITHSKKLIGERNEALRALGNKGTANKDASGTHQEQPTNGSAPKIPAQEAAAFKAAGMIYNAETKRFEKKLKNGDTVVMDPRTKKTILVRKAR